jgi:N-acetylmuramoyl-L-alanine amidase
MVPDSSRRAFLRILAGATAAVVLRPFRALAGTRRVEVICRRAWGADEPTGEFQRHRIRRLTVHHSGVVLTDNTKAPARFRSHQANHQARGWPDIAYHLLIDRHGNVYEGRPIRAVPDTATNYDPRGHFTVMCEGNFQEQRPSKLQVAALADVLAWAVERYGVGVRTIHGHLEYADTACPGRGLQRRLDEVRRIVRDRIRSGGVRLTEICGREGRQRVEDIEAGHA